MHRARLTSKTPVKCARSFIHSPEVNAIHRFLSRRTFQSRFRILQTCEHTRSFRPPLLSLQRLRKVSSAGSKSVSLVSPMLPWSGCFVGVGGGTLLGASTRPGQPIQPGTAWPGPACSSVAIAQDSDQRRRGFCTIFSMRLLIQLMCLFPLDAAPGLEASGASAGSVRVRDLRARLTIHLA